MYNDPNVLSSVGVAGATATLPFTGLPLHWMVLAAFVLVMAGIALMTMAPRNRAEVAKVCPPELREVTAAVAALRAPTR